MTKKPEPAPKVEPLPVGDVPHAPFIFYENAPAFGHLNGVINVTLAASRVTTGPGGSIISEPVVVAYLRGNIQAALSLRAALDQALLLAAPAAGSDTGKAN